MPDTVLDVRAVSRRYGDRTAVSDASFRLQAGRIACLLGPSGCGKSTLLRMIAGLEPVDEGEIAIGDRVVSGRDLGVAPEDRGVGLVFQDCALFPHLTVTDNVGFGLAGLGADRRRQRVAALLARFHLEPLARAWPHTLSGGEQQRVAIARALAREPAVLLLDEPFSGLDEQLRADVRRSVLADLRAMGASVLMVTHDPEEAMLIADDLLLMIGGRILQSGSPEDCYRRPVSPAIARLLGEVALLPAAIRDGVAHSAFGAVPASDLPDGSGQLIVRPEALRLDGKGHPATVVSASFAGPFHAIDLTADDVRAILHVAAEPPAPGAVVRVSLDPSLAVAFRADEREA